MQQKERKYLKLILNADSADFAVGPDEVVNSENVRFGTTDAGVVDTVESIGSTTLLSEIQPSVSTVVIGSADDIPNNRIVYFIADLYADNDKIICYYVETNIFYTVLLNSQVIGGLNFDKNSLIHSARIIDGMIYWVEGITNEPRKINIDAGIKLNNPGFITNITAYVAPIDWREITIIKSPPPFAPTIQKNYDSGFVNNFIANESFMFSYQFIYYDNETSVNGTYSTGSRLNAVTDNFNRIIVTMNPLQIIPQTVRIVNLIVRYANSAFIIKTWDKLISSENTELSNQNNGSQILTFNFYNNVTGQALSSDAILKPFDSVPIYSKGLERSVNRLFLSNNIAGYDAPKVSSLSCFTTMIDISAAGGNLTKNLIQVTMSDLGFFFRHNYSAWYVYITEIAPSGYYAITSTEQFCAGCLAPPPFPPPPTTVALSGLTFRGASQADALSSVNAAYSASMVYYNFSTTSNIVTITGTAVTTFNIFKTRAQYKLGIVFYDYAMRKCSVVTPPFDFNQSDPTLINIPARNFNFTQGVNSIVWQLSNDNSLNEIPEWAHYYSIVRTLNLRTRYFINVLEQNHEARYVTRDTNGNYVFTNETFVNGAIGIGIDTTAMIQAGLGYTFTEGDICYINTEGFSPSPPETNYTLSVIGQSGKYIIVNVPEGGIGDLGAFKFFYEIYTPYQASEQEPFYEVGHMYQILNPRTSGRLYSTLSDILGPDAYAITRNYTGLTYFAEAMSPNDRFFNRWDNDSGKVNEILKSGQTIKTNFISFSNTFIPGTSTNGLSTFEALNEKNVPLENGPIQKIILTSKTQDQGSVMLAICSNETSSIYLGEQRITDSTGATQFFASASDVIGTINTLKGSYGTLDPSSVVEFRGNVFWLDRFNGKIIQYSANGLFPISSYKMTRFWKLFSDQFNSMTQQQIEDLGNRPFVFATVDPHHMELLISIPKLLNVPPKGMLPDYPFKDYPYDIWDGKGKTIVYKLNQEPNHWQGSYRFVAENFITIQNKLFSFKNGQLYLHNSLTSQCVFYGIQDKARIMCLSNMLPQVPKSYNNMTIQANIKPSFVYMYNDYPYQQSSDLINDDFRPLEGVFYSSIYRNKLVPTSTGYAINGLLTGEKMRAESLKIMLEFDVSQKQLEFKFLDLGFSVSSGHTTI